MICAGCAAEIPDGDLFCENCGLRLGPAPEPVPACLCGAPLDEADEEGFCGSCGRRVRRPPSDYIEQAISPDFAGISDRGLQHERNEDRFALVVGECGLALVVCDGVSTTSHAEVAAETVATAVAANLRDNLLCDPPPDAVAALLAAIGEASAALATKTEASARHTWGDTAPSTTVVAAALVEDELTVAWAGDSRAYWIDEADGVTALTQDHSWLNATLREGRLSEEQAQRSPQAHAILRWIGGDADPGNGPEVLQRRLATPGALLLCSDGLWNYAATERDLHALWTEATAIPGTDALAILRHLVAFANAEGGRDNITAVLLRWTPPSREAAPIEPGNSSLRTGEEGQ